MVYRIQRLFAAVCMAAAVCSTAFCPTAVAQSPAKPNVLVIVADDLGYSDLGCFGGEIKTPHLDALTKTGVRFTGIYNEARCCPSRASVMTGLYAHQAGMGGMSEATTRPGYLGHIKATAPTLAEALKPTGYRTAAFGKWHLANTLQRPNHAQDLNRKTFPDVFCPIEQYPTRRGFDVYWGALWGLVNFYNPFSLVDNETPVKELPADFFMTHAINDKAADYITATAKSDKPFFMYLANNAPHWPLHALPGDIAKYKDQYRDGYGVVRKARYDRMVQMGLIDPNVTALSPTTGDWDKFSPQEKTFCAALYQTHAAMVDELDQGLGRVFQSIKDAGQWDNTLIFFFSDNGASPEDGYGPGFDRPAIARDGKPIRHKYDDLSVLAGGEHTFYYIGRDWANVANTPYRKAKASQYNGGERTPMIVHWPAGMKAKAGSIVQARGHVIDLMPTILEAAGATLPDTFAGAKPHPLQGVSLMPLLKGEPTLPNYPTLFGEHEGGKSVLTPDGYKLIKDRGEKVWHLYDLNSDQSELNDQARREPARVEQLRALWDAWAKENNVEP